MSQKKAKGGKQKAGKKGSQAASIALTAHPRAQRQIGLAKSYAGLGAFALAGWSAYHNGLPFLDVTSRALLWGMATYVLVWALAVHVWRHVAVAEVRAAENRWRERNRPNDAQVEKLTAILEDNGMPTTGTGAMPPM